MNTSEKMATMNILNTVVRSVVCIDKTVRGDFVGRLYNCYMEEPIEFEQINQMLGAINRLLNRVNWPQATFELRSFSDVKPKLYNPETIREYMTLEELDNFHGALATFSVAISTRQNATWQGEIIWVETGTALPFASELELLRVMGDTMQALKTKTDKLGR